MHDLGVVAGCDSLASAVALEALVDVADDLQLVVHGEMQLLPPNLSGPRPCIKLVLLPSLENLNAVDVEVDLVQPSSLFISLTALLTLSMVSSLFTKFGLGTQNQEVSVQTLGN